MNFNGETANSHQDTPVRAQGAALEFILTDKDDYKTTTKNNCETQKDKKSIIRISLSDII